MFLEIRTDTWESARKFGKWIGKGTEWIFRGQSDLNWKLTTTFERAMKSFNYPSRHCKDRENVILKQFQRRAHHYLQSPPKTSETLEWLALIQHHGGPTRLLDFTYSFYVAAFFAIEKAPNDAAVWIINIEELEQGIYNVSFESELDCNDNEDRNTKHIRISEACIAEDKSVKLVLKVEPSRMFERQIIQNGLFLFPCDIKSSFLLNLKYTFDERRAPNKKKVVEFKSRDKFDYSVFSEYPIIKLVIPRNSHKYALSDLNEMNINSSTLFPSIDGFARSLFYYMRAFDLDDETYTYS